MESVGVSGILLPLVIAVELLGGLAIILGWHTRIAAFLLAGGFLMLVALGAGPWSIDNRNRS